MFASEGGMDKEKRGGKGQGQVASDNSITHPKLKNVKNSELTEGIRKTSDRMQCNDLD